MAGGQKISDHSNGFMGSKSKESILPMGVKFKGESSAEGSGELSHYEDTTETIKSQQEMANKKVKSHPQKVGHRN